MVLACGSPEKPLLKAHHPSPSLFHATGLRVVQEEPADGVISGYSAELVIYTYFSPVLCT